MTKQFDAMVFIGRFQPLHNAHVFTINRALELAEKVIVVIGSCDRPRNLKNPFTKEERKYFIKSLFPGDNVIVDGTYDSMYNNDAWALRVQNVVHQYTSPTDKIGIIGHKKDATTEDYLKMFPQWGDPIEVPFNQDISATQIRDLYFNGADLHFFEGVMHPQIIRFLSAFREENVGYGYLIQEKEFIEKYKRQFSGYPYLPYFITTDVVCTQSAHVLMVERGAMPGKGQLALPGGFLGQQEFLIDSALRELKEETKIDVPLKVLRGSIQGSHVFDHPNRSFRGRTVTHTFAINLPPGPLPSVKGGDDARSAQWIPYSELDPTMIYEDHWEQIMFMRSL
jgi:bifunctional NMN adenylyltransferase/nudix hydrolase